MGRAPECALRMTTASQGSGRETRDQATLTPREALLTAVKREPGRCRPLRSVREPRWRPRRSWPPSIRRHGHERRARLHLQHPGRRPAAIAGVLRRGTAGACSPRRSWQEGRLRLRLGRPPARPPDDPRRPGTPSPAARDHPPPQPPQPHSCATGPSEIEPAPLDIGNRVCVPPPLLAAPQAQVILHWLSPSTHRLWVVGKACHHTL